MKRSTHLVVGCATALLLFATTATATPQRAEASQTAPRAEHQPGKIGPFLEAALPLACQTHLQLEPPQTAGIVWAFVVNFEVIDHPNTQNPQPQACIRFIPNEALQAKMDKRLNLPKGVHAYAGYITRCDTKEAVTYRKLPAGTLAAKAKTSTTSTHTTQAVFNGGRISCRLYEGTSLKQLIDDFLKEYGIVLKPSERTFKYDVSSSNAFDMDKFSISALGDIAPGFSQGDDRESPIITLRSRDATHMIMLSTPLPKNPNPSPTNATPDPDAVVSKDHVFESANPDVIAPGAPGIRLYSKHQKIGAINSTCRSMTNKTSLFARPADMPKGGDWGFYYQRDPQNPRQGIAKLVYNNVELCRGTMPVLNLWLADSVVEIATRGDGYHLNMRGTLDELVIDPTGSVKPPGGI